MKMSKQVPLLSVLTLLFAFTAGAQVSTDQTGGPAPIVVYQAKYPVNVQGNDFDLLNMILEFPKGAGVPEHYHGGNVLVTVLSGEMTLSEKGTVKVVKTGESWTEAPGAVHAVMNKGESARVAVSMLLPKGAEVQTLVK